MKQSPSDTPATTSRAEEDWQNGGFGLYIHWPYCQSKCPYCDFNSHVAKHIDQGLWLSALSREIDRVAALTSGRMLRSIFFGGGTPSLMAPETVSGLVERARAAWRQENRLEVTLEANPTSVEAERFEAYREAGVTRVSIGIQALDDNDLRQLGRLHSVADGLKAFELARKIFPQVSFDLIYARQNQSAREWRSELQRALALEPDHLSLYQLTIEQGTRFGELYSRGRLSGLPDEDLGAELYEITQDLCAENGLLAYEVSNHARSGHESLHNLIYWNYGDYAGIGPGAHGRLTKSGIRHATIAISNPKAWLRAVETFGTGDESTTALSSRDQAAEFLMMGLRLHEGIDPERFRLLNGVALDDAKVRDLMQGRHLENCAGRIRATEKGRGVLNAVLRHLL
ncbi:MAG: radical SAM family heme chaperone HemW [Pararhodobacter sp.]